MNKESVFYSKIDIEKVDVSIFTQIESAIRNKNKIKIQYKMDNSIVQLIVKPLKISNFEGYWYLHSLDDGELKK